MLCVRQRCRRRRYRGSASGLWLEEAVQHADSDVRVRFRVMVRVRVRVRVRCFFVTRGHKWVLCVRQR